MEGKLVLLQLLVGARYLTHSYIFRLKALKAAETGITRANGPSSGFLSTFFITVPNLQI